METFVAASAAIVLFAAGYRLRMWQEPLAARAAKQQPDQLDSIGQYRRASSDKLHEPTLSNDSTIY